ncbi:MAG: hypothetical protein FWD69_10605 [Polyangiaceae bacterium]|nr:hypothetical protein [Polyangiaceae bacterium]
MSEYWTPFCDISGGQITNWIHLYVEAAESVALLDEFLKRKDVHVIRADEVWRILGR